MSSRTLFIITLIAAFAFTAMATISTTTAAPTTTQESSGGNAMTNGNYDINGLPTNIFPDYSKFVLADTDEINDGLHYLQEQGSGVKLPN